MTVSTTSLPGTAGSVSCGYKPSSLQAADTLMQQFSARPVPQSWQATRLSRGRVLARVAAPAFARSDEHAQQVQHHGVRAVLAWLSRFPGESWQDRFLASNIVAENDNAAWKHTAADWWSQATGVSVKRAALLISTGLLTVIGADVIRPDPAWLMTPRAPRSLTVHLPRARDPHGWARLLAWCEADPASAATKSTALCRIAVILAAKGGTIGEITVGDCLQLLQIVRRLGGGKTTSGYFYQLLHAVGVFEPSAPPTVRAFGTTGQISVEQLIDRYHLVNRPIRGLLVHYLRERQVTLDYVSLQRLAGALGKLFWADLERHHPGIDS
ncbi:MAG: site-specific integrase, partial [Mycobacterium sp.]